MERACVVIRSAIATAMDWSDIELLVKDAQARGDLVAMVIHSLKLSSNEITLLLRLLISTVTMTIVYTCKLFFAYTLNTNVYVLNTLLERHLPNLKVFPQIFLGKEDLILFVSL